MITLRNFKIYGQLNYLGQKCFHGQMGCYKMLSARSSGRKDKLLILKWDSLCKRVGQKKAKKNIGLMKKGEWYYTKSCKHVKNHVELASHNCQAITQQVANGVVGEKAKKVMYFTIVLCMCYNKVILCLNMSP